MSRRNRRPPSARRPEPWLSSVPELVAELQGLRLRGQSQSDLLDHLHAVAAAHGFEVRNDSLFLTPAEVGRAEAAVQDAHGGLCLPRAPRRGADTVRVTARVMLCRQGRGLPRARRDQATELDLASGIVFDALRWEVLAVTPRMFSLSPDEGAVDQHLAAGRYAVIRPRDGSLVTLYNWRHPLRGSVWCLATSRGYDVSGLLCPGGNTSWAEMVHGVMARTGVAEALGATLTHDVLNVGDVRLGLARVSPAFCYTLSVRCHAMHPLLADPEAVCTVQAVRLTPEADEPLSFQPFFESMLEGVADQVRVEGVAPPPLTLSALRTSCAGALPAAVAAVAAGQPADFDYGYVLRAFDPAETGGNSDLVIESPLQVRIRQEMYRPPAAEDASVLEETPEVRMQYNAVRAAFSPRGSRKEVVGLFPQYADLIRRCGEFMEAVAEQTVARALQLQGGAPPPERTGPTTNVERHAAAVLRHITQQHANFNPFDAETARSIVDGYVYEAMGPLTLLQACP